MRPTRLLEGVLAITLTALQPIGCAAGEPESTSGSSAPPSEPSSPVSPENLVGWGDFDDALLDLRLEITLLEQVGIGALRVEIHSSTGTVWLGGRVPDPPTAARVRHLVRATRGVVEIVDDLSLADDPIETTDSLDSRQRLLDALLAARARQALVGVFGRSAFEIGIEASDSHLILRGTVADHRSRERAIAAATTVRGVEEVHDLLRLAG